jgi:hypothetical protein
MRRSETAFFVVASPERLAAIGRPLRVQVGR